MGVDLGLAWHCVFHGPGRLLTAQVTLSGLQVGLVVSLGKQLPLQSRKEGQDLNFFSNSPKEKPGQIRMIAK